MRYLSVCSGIEAASVAWHPLGWEPVAFSEIEAFPSAVLRAHYPHTPNLGDMTKFQEWPDFGSVDLLVGGTPCQSFSVAGLRRGLADPRGNLMLTFGALAGRYRPRWLVWENVPGVLSSDGGRDFGSFLGMLGLLGYGYAYRVLDAQFFGLAQRRKRVFVIGHLGDWRPAAAVFLERAGLRGDPAPSRKARKDVAGTIAASTRGSDENDAADGRLISGTLGTTSHDPTRDNIGEGLVASTVSAKWAKGRGGYAGQNETENCVVLPMQDPAYALGASPGAFRSYGEGQFNYVTHALRGEGFDASEDGTGRGTPLVPVAFTCKDHGADAADDLAPTLRAMGHAQSHANAGGQIAIAHAFDARQSDVIQYGDKTGPLDTDGHSVAVAFTASEQANSFAWERGVYPTLNAQAPSDSSNIQYGVRLGSMVRRLTPRECERLQGFPDDYTLITYRGKPAADGPRYKALGNSMAVPCMRWIGERIMRVERIARAHAPAKEMEPLK